MTQLLITGTREGRTDVRHYLAAYLANYPAPTLCIIGGDLNDGVCSQRGVDLQATEYLRSVGLLVHVEYALWPDPAAGPQRNVRMVAMCQRGDHCLAFPHHDPTKQRGTRNCFNLANAAGLKAWWLL